ncbi:MAG: hypothetical protein ACYCZF_18335, partial [Anaerolineae bacterium]
SFVIVVSALGLYLMLAMLSWAAPQPGQADTSSQVRWLTSPSANAIADVPDTNVLYLPVIHRQTSPTPLPTPTPIPFLPIPGASRYDPIPVDPYYNDGRPDYAHADLNLEMRGWVQVNEYLGLWDYSGDTHEHAPRLAELFLPNRVPTFLTAYRVYDWQWEDLPKTGYPTYPILRIDAFVSLVRMQTATDEIIYLPGRVGPIYEHGGRTYYAQVLYATSDQITLKYTREGNVKYGYTVHIENIWVDPELVAVYVTCNLLGRHDLPALTHNQPFGRAKAGGILVAIRDNGTFMDPRSRKDWWPGY